ncbi:hypothetical protein [Viridibacillus arvi]|uniref:hypothetical protein n=1 Tax=Viridibacillus arvi TaxID=263475 RepID=UPI0034CF4BA2
MSENKALAMLMIETYTAWQHRGHILKVWELLGFHHVEAYKDYCDKLMGKHLTGREDIWRSLYFADYKDLYEFRYKIPEKFAMGDALGVAYKVLNSK